MDFCSYEMALDSNACRQDTRRRSARAYRAADPYGFENVEPVASVRTEASDMVSQLARLASTSGKGGKKASSLVDGYDLAPCPYGLIVRSRSLEGLEMSARYSLTSAA